MAKRYVSKISIVVLILIFTLSFLSSFAFASSGLIKKGTVTNFNVFYGSKYNYFKIPKAVEYYDSSYDYSIVIQEGSIYIDALAKEIRTIVNKLPDALIPRGAQIIIADSATAGPKNTYRYLTIKNQMYLNLETLEIKHIIHEAIYYKEWDFEKNSGRISDDSEEYFNALKKDQELNGKKLVSTSAYVHLLNLAHPYKEQFAGLVTYMYKGFVDSDPRAKKEAVEKIKSNPYQAKFIIENFMNGEKPILPDGVDAEDIINEALGKSVDNNKPTAHKKNASEEENSDSSNISSINGVSSYSDKEKSGSGEEGSTDDPEIYYYIDEEGNEYYLDEEGNEYYLDEEGNEYYLDEEGNEYYLDEDGNKYYTDEEGNEYYLEENS